MLSAAAATNGIPVLPPVNPLKFTVVTWCALLTRDLLVIANFTYIHYIYLTTKGRLASDMLQ